MDIDSKKALSNHSRALLAREAAKWDCGVEKYISRKMALDYAELCLKETDWRNRWVRHPKNTRNEPLRRIQYLTDTGRKNLLDIG
ncbi:MAG: hypothetical protein VX228_02380 [Pseudomonadota bacterium]|nr:hypothetical protein [Pseudomonadota bacterium]